MSSTATPLGLDDVKDRLIRVEKIEVQGLHRTKPEIVNRELSKLDGTLLSLADLVATLDDVHERMSSLGIFDVIDIEIDEGNFSSRGCTVHVKVRESSLFQVHSGTYIQGGAEASAEVAVNVNNRFGWAEQISLSADYGSRRTNLFSLATTVPRPWNTPSIVDVRMYQNFMDRQSLSSYMERLRAISATVTSEDGKHSLSYEFGWRRLTDPRCKASAPVLKQLGDHIKSSVRYHFHHSTLDDLIFPRTGWAVNSSIQLCGLRVGQQVPRAIRQQAIGQVAFPVGSLAALHVEGMAGLLLSWPSAGSRASNISERFFLGGVCNEGLRGIRYHSFGPLAPRRLPQVSSCIIQRSQHDSWKLLCKLLPHIFWIFHVHI